MGLFEKFKELTRPYDDEDDEEFLDDEPAQSRVHESPPRTPVSQRGTSSSSSGYSGFQDFMDKQTSHAPPTRGDKVVNIHATTQLQVILVKPERFENAAEIADHLRERRTVVLNLEQTQKDIARRLIDFLSGVAYAQDGKIKKVAISTYIITPYNVDIMGDLIDELENNGLYF